ncbi:arf-GAP domain and FG repeat-containing protein 1 isoform X2 [Drosophila innubila]|uniref:arf-GAP domain and FG repeat-containing protein 1 isoform X2 n=1 Tax=Drosophila innubila TaxID=198719 RepID=UPI00148D0D8F|nr:arf-GAP domain and FG repeat-containing protein 1 isoform X2 [Drosophila innubila]
MAVRKKQDDKYLLALRELVNSGAGNRQCFDCNQKGPTYVNMTIGSFVCTRCSGVLRGLTPPHRVKSISMATFTQEELDFLQAHGNELCAKTWLGLWDPKRATPQQDQRELMIDKYERKRYYLEPASPLKSLANAVNLKQTTSSNNNNNNNNDNAHNGYNGHTGHTVISQCNGYASIHLTPPTQQRTAANGLAKTASSTTAISRPQHHHHHNQNLNQHSHHDAFNGLGMGMGLGLSSLNSAGSTSTGALSDTSSCASNGFAGDSDFVADFGSANIFDATSARSTGSPAVSSASSVGSSNGYAKVQPLRAAHLQQQQQQQQHLLNGNSSENFADFEHAPIYNGVAGATLQSSQLSQSTLGQKNSPKGGSAPSADRYAALKDLDEQLRELKASEAVATVATEAPTPTNNNHSNTHIADAFGSVAVNPFKNQQQQQQQQLLINHVVNPFQANNNNNNNNQNQNHSTHHQHHQQQQQNLYGQLTLIPNGYGSSPLQNVGQQLMQPKTAATTTTTGPHASFFNFNNNGFAVAQGLPNGCGFGSMQPAPVLAGGMSSAFNNPFAASGAINTNNPFL